MKKLLLLAAVLPALSHGASLTGPVADSDIWCGIATCHGAQAGSGVVPCDVNTSSGTVRAMLSTDDMTLPHGDFTATPYQIEEYDSDSFDGSNNEMQCDYKYNGTFFEGNQVIIKVPDYKPTYPVGANDHPIDGWVPSNSDPTAFTCRVGAGDLINCPVKKIP